MSEIDRLLVGDVVKVETKGEIVYVELTKIDRYKYDTPCNDVLNFYVKDDKL